MKRKKESSMSKCEASPLHGAECPSAEFTMLLESALLEARQDREKLTAMDAEESARVEMAHEWYQARTRA
jgi:hypothetical protein